MCSHGHDPFRVDARRTRRQLGFPGGIAAVESAIVERALLWAFIAGLAWCPFWFGSYVLLAWGINAVLFPGLVAIYELSLLIRGERHPVAIRQIKASCCAVCRRRAVDFNPECDMDP